MFPSDIFMIFIFLFFYQYKASNLFFVNISWVASQQHNRCLILFCPSLYLTGFLKQTNIQTKKLQLKKEEQLRDCWQQTKQQP